MCGGRMETARYTLAHVYRNTSRWIIPAAPPSFMADSVTNQLQPSSLTNDIDMAKYGKSRRTRWRPHLRTQTHPFLFTLMTLTAAAELGLTAFLISAGNKIQVSTGAYRSLYVLLMLSS